MWRTCACTHGLWEYLFVVIGSIYDMIQKSGPIRESQIVGFVRQIVTALTHLQDLKIVHRYDTLS